MNILVTGARGFLGAVLDREATDEGWAVDGLDLDLYHDGAAARTDHARVDFQDLTADDLAGYDAVVHLAGISSDSACDLRGASSARVNGSAAVEFAALAKRAGVRRFVFASSCSVYGSAPNHVSTETSPCVPLSVYAQSKFDGEAGILALASSTFSPTVLRLATLYGLSPNLRSDLVVNAMVASAYLTGEIVVHGTGLQGRPLLNVRDAASAILDVLKCSDDEMAGEVFNVTDASTGYTIAKIADVVQRHVAGSRIVHHLTVTDRRHYLVDGNRIRRFCHRPLMTLEQGVGEVSLAMADADWQRRAAVLESNRTRRLRHLLEQGDLTDELRWRR